MTVLDTQPDLLDLIAMAPAHSTDAERVTAAIRSDALAHHGVADPNRVREALTSGGELQVNPRVLSASYSALCRSGVIAQAGWTENTDLRSRNRGRPARTWRWLATA